MGSTLCQEIVHFFWLRSGSHRAHLYGTRMCDQESANMRPIVGGGRWFTRTPY